MIQRRQHSRLALEARQPLPIMREGLGQHLDGDFASKLRVVCQVDLSHPTCTEQREDLIGAELPPH